MSYPRSRSVHSPTRTVYELAMDDLNTIRRAGEPSVVERSLQSLQHLRETEMQMFSEVPVEYTVKGAGCRGEAAYKARNVTKHNDEYHPTKRSVSSALDHIGNRLCDPNQPLPLNWQDGDRPKAYHNVKSKYSEKAAAKGTRREEVAARRQQFLSKMIPRVRTAKSVSHSVTKPPLIVSSVFVPSCASKPTKATTSRRSAARLTSMTKMIR